MSKVLGAVTSTVSARPRSVIAVVLAVTVVLAWFAGQAERADEVVVENELTLAADVLDEHFADPTSVLQVLLTADDDVRSVAGLESTMAIEDAIEQGPVSDTLAEDAQPAPVISYLTGVRPAIESQDIQLDELSDSDVRDYREQVASEAPEGTDEQLDQLLTDDPAGNAGLMLVFQDTEGLTEDQARAQQEELAQVVNEMQVADGVTAEPFSMALLMDSDGEVGAEVAQLFTGALVIILVALWLHYWMPPARGERGRVLRRTASEVGLTLAVILMAVVWMQGAGVLLGPGYLGLVGPFSASAQIVPVLIVGLGVDFAIHFLGRYRQRLAHGASPDLAVGTAGRTVGVTLLVCTVVTAAGFLTNLTSPLGFLGMLGVLAAAGIAAAFLLTMTFLAAARVLLDRRGGQRERLPLQTLKAPDHSRLTRVSGAGAWLAKRAPAATLAVALLLTGVGAASFAGIESRFDVTDFVSMDEPMRDTFNRLETAFDGDFDRTTDVLVTGPVATPEAHNALVDVAGGLNDLDEINTSAQPVTSPVAVLDDAMDDEDLGEDLAQAGVSDDLTVDADTDVAAVYDLLREQTDADQVLAPVDDGYVAQVVIDGGPAEGREQALRTELEQVLQPLEETGVDAVPTSQDLIEDQMTADIANTQLTTLLVALGAAMVVLVGYYAVVARAPALGVVTILPVAAVLALTLGTMALTGIPLNPVTATLAALSIGIGVPFMIHLSNRFLEERTNDSSALEAVRRALHGTGTALLASALTTAVGFGVLMTSSLLPFQQLGVVIVYAIVFSLLTAILVLPSALLLWDRLRRRGRPGSGSTDATTQTRTVSNDKGVHV